jgi:metal-dependent amidase/aminoacylase/carboxypeptidase family protein
MELKEQIDHLLSNQWMEEMVEIRRHFHRHPELSFQEHQTSATIRELLDRWDVEYDFPFVETGIVARIQGNTQGPRIALRSDMDALPIREHTGLGLMPRKILA